LARERAGEESLTHWRYFTKITSDKSAAENAIKIALG
jgi:hypothetical protein